jgi:LPXTG-site transpeptidase (sortase) family protein
VRLYAVLIGLLVGLAAAPAVGRTRRAQSFDVAAPGNGTTQVTGVEQAAARTPDPSGPARSGTAGGAGTGDLTELTHRSAAIEEVAHRPVRLRIDALGADAPIEAFGRDGDGQLDVPMDGATVAWYREGSVPGAAGSSVLAAHVDHDGRRGVFFDLDTLQAGDTVRVDFDDGRTLTFDVVRRRRYAKEDLPVHRLFSRNGDAVLTLITCGGRFDPTTRHYDANTVVQATLR